MGSLLQATVAAAVSFIATNIDDIFVLMLFFGRKDGRKSGWRIVAGQYLGFAALVAVCLVGYFARYVAPREWIGLLGLLPLAIGVKQLSDRRKAKGAAAHDSPEVEPATAGTDSLVWTVTAVTFANGADNI